MHTCVALLGHHMTTPFSSTIAVSPPATFLQQEDEAGGVGGQGPGGVCNIRGGTRRVQDQSLGVEEAGTKGAESATRSAAHLSVGVY